MPSCSGGWSLDAPYHDFSFRSSRRRSSWGLMIAPSYDHLAVSLHKAPFCRISVSPSAFPSPPKRISGNSRTSLQERLIMRISVVSSSGECACTFSSWQVKVKRRFCLPTRCARKIFYSSVCLPFGCLMNVLALSSSRQSACSLLFSWASVQCFPLVSGCAVLSSDECSPYFIQSVHLHCFLLVSKVT